MQRKSRNRLTAGVALSALSLASMAAAQQASGPAGAREATATTLSDIIVTAEKRSERLQDVQLSIAVVTGASLQNQGITNFADFAVKVPGIHVSEDSTQSSFTIRGISSAAYSDTTSAPAGIFVDDYPLYDTWFRFASPDLHLFDINQIEVLRGPQGTLYGATSLSGSVRIITNKPNLDTFGAAIEATGSGTDGGAGNYALNGMVNIPVIVDKLAVRAVGYYTDNSGWIDNPVRSETNVNDERSYGGRFDVKAQLDDNWSVLASLTAQHDVHDDQNATYYFPPPGDTVNDFNSPLPTKTQVDLFIASLVVDRKLGAGDLSLSATYGSDRSRNVGDGTFISALLGVPALTPFLQPSNSDTEIFEARFTSDASKPFRYVVGAYYNTRYRTLLQQAFQPALIPVWGTSNIYDVYANQRAAEAAVYGEANWDFAPKWEATVGVRVFNNSYDFNSRVSGLLNSISDPLTPFLTHVTNNNTSATPRFSLSYKPDRNINLYATVSEGYRFGLTNYNSGANPGIPLAYKPDELWNYEVGAKTAWFDGRMTFNSSLYYMDWRDIQISFRNTNGQVYVTNAGNARSYGWENELNWRPNSSWEIDGALSLGKAEMTTANPGIERVAPSIRGPAVYGVLPGDALPGSQKINASGGIQYNLPRLGNGDPYIRVDDIYVGGACVDFICAGSLKIGDYNLVNLRAGYKFGNYEIVVFADNAFNSHGIENAIPDVDGLGLTDAAYRVHPRTIGVTLRAKYLI